MWPLSSLFCCAQRRKPNLDRLGAPEGWADSDGVPVAAKETGRSPLLATRAPHGNDNHDAMATCQLFGTFHPPLHTRAAQHESQVEGLVQLLNSSLLHLPPRPPASASTDADAGAGRPTGARRPRRPSSASRLAAQRGAPAAPPARPAGAPTAADDYSIATQASNSASSPMSSGSRITSARRGRSPSVVAGVPTCAGLIPVRPLVRSTSPVNSKRASLASGSSSRSHRHSLGLGPSTPRASPVNPPPRPD